MREVLCMQRSALQKGVVGASYLGVWVGARLPADAGTVLPARGFCTACHG